MFAFTSTGGKVDHWSINRGRAPYVYHLNGQNHHVFGTLIPDDGQDPKFCQLNIYDTEHEVQNKKAVEGQSSLNRPCKTNLVGKDSPYVPYIKRQWKFLYAKHKT